MPSHTASRKSAFGRVKSSNHSGDNYPLVPSDHTFVSRIDDNVANCVTLEEDGSFKRPSSSGVINDNYKFNSVLQPAASNLLHSKTPADRRKVPELSSEGLAKKIRRKLFERSPASEDADVSPSSSSKLPPKSQPPSRNSSVFRHNKMSLSSSPPGIKAGYWTLNYLAPSSNVSNQFQPIHRPWIDGFCVNETAIGKRESAMSTSPAFSSVSSRSSTSSTGMVSRKRRADNDFQRCSGHSSTSEMVAAVSHFNLQDRLSTGSVSPADVMMHQLSKRSKNDHEEDDDVIFVSHEPGPGTKSQPEIPNVFVSPSHAAPVKANKVRRKKVSTVYSNGHAHAISQSNSVVAAPELRPFVYLADVLSTTPAPLASSTPSKKEGGYFLRSSVNRPNNKVPISSKKVDLEAPTCKYHTRSQRKLKYSSPEKPPSPAIVKKGYPNNESSFEEEAKDFSFTRSSSFKSSYEIKGQIGVGGGGVVFSGIRKSDSANVAIKRVAKEKVKRWGKLNGTKVPLEFELLFKAKAGGNTGVIQMYDFFERKTSFILVMERPEPVMDLFDYLNNHGAMKESLAKDVFRQVVTAVQKCHANGILHRDIKDENVLINKKTNEAKLIDFGCGTYLKNGLYEEFAGTPEFYPPEWFTNRRYYGNHVDAWSLGILLYTIVQSEVPFPKEEDTIKCDLKYKYPDKLSWACRDLLEHMLKKNPKERLSLEEIVNHPWLQEVSNDSSSSSFSEGDYSLSNSDTLDNSSTSTSDSSVLMLRSMPKSTSSNTLSSQNCSFMTSSTFTTTICSSAAHEDYTKSESRQMQYLLASEQSPNDSNTSSLGPFPVASTPLSPPQYSCDTSDNSVILIESSADAVNSSLISNSCHSGVLNSTAYYSVTPPLDHSATSSMQSAVDMQPPNNAASSAVRYVSGYPQNYVSQSPSEIFTCSSISTTPNSRHQLYVPPSSSFSSTSSPMGSSATRDCTYPSTDSYPQTSRDDGQSSIGCPVKCLCPFTPHNAFQPNMLANQVSQTLYTPLQLHHQSLLRLPRPSPTLPNDHDIAIGPSPQSPENPFDRGQCITTATHGQETSFNHRLYATAASQIQESQIDRDQHIPLTPQSPENPFDRGQHAPTITPENLFDQAQHSRIPPFFIFRNTFLSSGNNTSATNVWNGRLPALPVFYCDPKSPIGPHKSVGSPCPPVRS